MVVFLALKSYELGMSNALRIGEGKRGEEKRREDVAYVLSSCVPTFSRCDFILLGLESMLDIIRGLSTARSIGVDCPLKTFQPVEEDLSQLFLLLLIQHPILIRITLFLGISFEKIEEIVIPPAIEILPIDLHRSEAWALLRVASQVVCGNLALEVGVIGVDIVAVFENIVVLPNAKHRVHVVSDPCLSIISMPVA